MTSAAMKPPTTTNPGDLKHDGVKVTHAGLFRTGIASMAEAYRTLGYRAYHGLDDAFRNPWIEIERAVEATWPVLAKLPEYTYFTPDSSGPMPRPPFRRENWGRIWGSDDVATDLASPFVLELIKAYSEAKVVLVERPFEAWWPSFRSSILDTIYDRFSWLQSFVAWDILGIRATEDSCKVHAGFFGAPGFTKEWITEARARRAYEGYYKSVREAAPLESRRRLDYTLGSGWDPLCEFLGQEIPEREFPRVNDSGALAKTNRAVNAELVALVFWKLVFWAVPLAVLLFFLTVSPLRWAVDFS